MEYLSDGLWEIRLMIYRDQVRERNIYDNLGPGFEEYKYTYEIATERRNRYNCYEECPICKHGTILHEFSFSLKKLCSKCYLSCYNKK